MAGGGGSTGGIGAQSPAVNPPSPMGQAGNAIAGQIGNIGASAFGGAQQPIPAYGQPMDNQMPQYPAGGLPMGELQNVVQAQPFMGQPPMEPRMMGGEGYTPGFGQQTQGGMQNPYLQAAQQAQQAYRQQQGPAGLMALLGGNPAPATPTAPPTPTAQPQGLPNQIAAKPLLVPPRTPPAVANAIRGLAARKPMGRR